LSFTHLALPLTTFFLKPFLHLLDLGFELGWGAGVAGRLPVLSGTPPAGSKLKVAVTAVSELREI
jgi:hypothetical protein